MSRPTHHAEAGAAAYVTGQRFEKSLKFVHGLYRGAHIAHLMKKPIHTVPTGPGGRRIASGCGGADYYGWLYPLGRGICMEAKSSSTPTRSNPTPCADASLRIVNDRLTRRSKAGVKLGDGEGLKLTQLEDLCEAHEAGALACVAWESGTDWVGVMLGERLNDYRLAFYSDPSTRIPREEFHIVRLAQVGGAGPIVDDWLGTALIVERRLAMEAQGG